MRRLDIHHRKKLRNPARHLRAMRRWASDASTWLPPAHVLASEKSHFSFKLPVFQKLTSPRHTRPEWQRECLSCMMEAAVSIRRAYGGDRPYRVACLIGTPDLFWSEVTLFFDDRYFQTFVPPEKPSRYSAGAIAVETTPAEDSLLVRFGIEVPSGLVYRGGYRQVITDDEDPDGPQQSETWLICEPEFR